MKILLMLELEKTELNTLLGDNVAYRPDLSKKGDSFLVDYIIKYSPEIIISGTDVSSNVIQVWAKACRGVDLRLLVVNDKNIRPQSRTVNGVTVVDLAVTHDAGITALVYAEKLYTRLVTCRHARSVVERCGKLRKASSSVLLVGAGIVNLIAAYYLRGRGCQVTIIEASPDPRSHSDWGTLGCTHGGGNARMFTLTECDDYHDKYYSHNFRFNAHFQEPVSKSGWVIGDIGSFDEKEVEWTNDFKNVPIWLANLYNEDIFNLSHEAKSLWELLITEHPTLFENVEFKRNVLRVVSDEAYQQHQIKRQEWVKSTVKVLDNEDIVNAYPSLAAGCDNGTIVGGIEVVGFTLNIHRFVSNLLEHLERSGVTFKWDRGANSINRDADGVVSSITAGDQTYVANHYVVSPGAYGSSLLQGTLSENKVHGMLGAWISFPNLEPKLHQSVKISRPGHVANSGNIILAKDDKGSDILIFGSGFGYTGSDPNNIDANELECIYKSMEDYVKKTFPKAYEAALQSGQLVKSRKYCIRPWTATCLGVFEIDNAVDGCFIVSSGHNTGGFAQSTSSAMAIIAAIEGEEHIMHSLYHPQRFTSFYFDQRQCTDSSIDLNNLQLNLPIPISSSNSRRMNKQF